MDKRQKSGPDEGVAEGRIRKPFDKKTYRMKKYSDKYKLDKWEQNRRKTVLKEYYQSTKRDQTAGKYKPFDFDSAVPEGETKDEEGNEQQSSNIKEQKQRRRNYVMHPDLMAKETMRPYKLAGLELKRLKEQKLADKAEAAKQREEALAVYKRKKADKFKKLGKKSRSGQPLMRDRMQMLLEAVQNACQK